jgi:hypothetical protein
VILSTILRPDHKDDKDEGMKKTAGRSGSGDTCRADLIVIPRLPCS